MRTPTLPELFANLRERISGDTFVMRPGRIESYDASTQLVSVKPQLRDFSEDSEGNVVQHSLPIIANVPLVFPGIGGFRLTFPVSVGDPVMLLFADRSIDSWLNDGREAGPTDLRTHHLSDCVAVPGLHPNTEAWSGVDTSVVTLGSDGGNADFVALSTKTDNEITKLWTALNALVSAFNTHTHPCSATAGSGTATASAPLSGATSPPATASVASATVKIKG